jgi:Tol biopolymer transport system component
MNKRQFLVLFVLLLGFVACGGETVNDVDEGTEGGLTGTFFFIELGAGAQDLVQYDIQTQEKQILFHVPDNGWLSYIDVLPDGNEIVMTYAPPPPAGEIQFGYSHIYLMLTAAGSAPRTLVDRVYDDEIYFNPVWSPDGQAIYYSHVTPLDEEAGTFTTTLEWINVDTGTVNVIVENAIWPRLSPGGDKLAYISFDPLTLDNALFVADADGRNPMELIPMSEFLAIDVPIFSPDGQMIYFSAAVEAPVASLSWLDRVLGVKTAAAHNLPSDWWRIPATGGAPERLTELNEAGLRGVFAPDGRTLVFVTANGLYKMNADGSDIEKLLESTLMDSLSWIP